MPAPPGDSPHVARRFDGPATLLRPADLDTVIGRVGRWELLQQVGDGPLCEVFRARPNGSLGPAAAMYAVKRLRDAWQADPRVVQCFRREVMLGHRLSHPHLAPVLDGSVDVPPYYAVFPWLDGLTLAETIRQAERIPLADALWYARQTAEALDALHQAGWTHGDVKPSNLLRGPAGHITLLDLAFARQPFQPGSAVDRPVMGTVAYLAPEAITCALGYDIRADLYSLGVVLYEMLCGRLPLVAHDLAGLAQLHRQSSPIELRTIMPHLPRQVAALVHELLAKNPARRPSHPRELVDRLARLEVDHFADRQPLRTVAVGVYN